MKISHMIELLQEAKNKDANVTVCIRLKEKSKSIWSDVSGVDVRYTETHPSTAFIIVETGDQGE